MCCFFIFKVSNAICLFRSPTMENMCRFLLECGECRRLHLLIPYVAFLEKKGLQKEDTKRVGSL